MVGGQKHNVLVQTNLVAWQQATKVKDCGTVAVDTGHKTEEQS